MKQFDIYGQRASEGSLSSTELSGRYSMQAEGLRRAVLDIHAKLALLSTDRLLDVGCGVGDITIPLSMMVASTSCVDHPKVLERLRNRVPLEPIAYYPGEFSKISITARFEKILAYGVVICLASKEEVYEFIDKALSLLMPGGRLLVGDFVNSDKKARFVDSEKGKEFSRAWDAQVKSLPNGKNAEDFRPNPESIFKHIDDRFMMETLLKYRQMGFETFLLPQPSDLAFGHTREDILFLKHK